MTAKSCISGAPRIAAPESTAETPAIVWISTPGYSEESSSQSPLMPYTPASPEQTIATVLPSAAVLSARRTRSTSCRIGVVSTGLSGTCALMRSI